MLSLQNNPAGGGFLPPAPGPALGLPLPRVPHPGKGSGDPPGGAQHLHRADPGPLDSFWRGNINLSRLQMSFSFFFLLSILGEENGFFFATPFNVTGSGRRCWCTTDPLAAQPSGNLLPSPAWPLDAFSFPRCLICLGTFAAPPLQGSPERGGKSRGHGQLQKGTDGPWWLHCAFWVVLCVL